MAHDAYTGKDVVLTFTAAVTKWKSIRIEETSEKASTTCATDSFAHRVTKYRDAKITIRGLDTDNSGGLNFGEVQTLIGTNPSSLTFTDDAGTPASKLRSGFFTDYPTAKWVVDDVSGEWSEDPADWEVVLTPNNDDV